MDNQQQKHTPKWAYPAAIALLAALVFIQSHYFSAETTSVSQSHSVHSQKSHG
jgi:hypothetical protein